MGLDSVEILMKVETTFGIQIPDREAEKIITIEDFHNAVWKHLAGRYSDRCTSQALFYRLRKAFSEKFNFPPAQLRPDTKPEDVFPKDHRRRSYFDLARVLNLELPPLMLTRPWAMFLHTFGLLTIPGGLVVSLVPIVFFDCSKWTLLIPAGGICVTSLFSKLLEPKRTKIGSQTFRSFTMQVLALNYRAIVADEAANRKEMEFVINYIISDMMGIDPEEIQPDKRIADDLGID
jgi:acyl carrier protein